MHKLLSILFLCVLVLASAIPLSERHENNNGEHNQYGEHSDGHDDQYDGHRDSQGCPAPHQSCASQVRALVWTVKGFDYHASYIFSTPAHQNSWGYVNFNLSNTATKYGAVCSATSGVLTEFFFGNMWYPCTLPPTAPAGAKVEFQFSRPTGRLDVREAVVCKKDDKTTTFQASGTTKLTLTCTDEKWTNPNYTTGTGQFYSTETITCALVDVTIKPFEVA
jgi:hypothetical protein